MRITFIAFLLSVLFFVPSSYAGEKCDSVLSKASFYSPEQPGISGDRTEQLIGYLGSLFQDGILRLDMLIELESHLSSSNKQPGFKFGDAAGVVQEVHREALNEHLSSGEFQAERVLQWLSETIEQTQQEASSREVVATETQSILEDPKFVRIPKGKFTIQSFDYPNKDPLEKLVNRSRKRGPDKQVISFPLEIELLQDFEVMDTPVTQGMWLKIMEDIPDNSKVLLANGTVIDVDGSEVGLDHPVVNVNLLDAMVFANRLSILHGLKPVYILDTQRLNNKWLEHSTSEERRKLGVVAIDAPGGDPYKAEGYRLPTAAEYMHMLQLTGKDLDALADHHLSVGLDGIPQEEYWHLRPVDFEKPLNVGGVEMNDLYGNVRVWLSDASGGEYHLESKSFGAGAYYKPNIVMGKVDKKVLFGVHKNPWVLPVFNKNFMSKPALNYSGGLNRKAVGLYESGQLEKLYPNQIVTSTHNRHQSIGGSKAVDGWAIVPMKAMINDLPTIYDKYTDVGIRLVRTLPETDGGKK